jgi:hypothetical protein
MRAAQLYIKETGKYIQLGQDGDFPFTLSKSIAEIQDVSKRNKTFSKSFKIPATEDNVKALGYPHVIGTDLDAINVYKQQCFIIVNGNVIDDGYVYILKAKRNTDAIGFECQFVGGNEAWVVALQSLKMSDMTTNTSGTVLQLDYTDANILARVVPDPRTMLDPSYVFVNPYMYKFSDSDAENYDSTETYEGTSRNARGTDFWPAFRLDFLIDGIFGTATNPLVQEVFGFDSFELDSDFLTDNATHGFWDNIYYSDRSQDDYPNVTFGATEDWRHFLPTEVTMLDFFMNVCKTFNLIFSFDGITLKVEPRQEWTSWDGTIYDGFYSGDIDWSEKVSVNQEIQYKTSKYKRQVRMSWGTESYPIDDNMYPFITDENVSQPEVRYIIDLDSNNEEGITDIKLPFNTSLSKFYQAKFDRVRTRGFVGPITEDEANQATSITFDPDNSYSNRLFVFKSGSAPMGMPRHVNLISGVTGRYTGIEAYLYTPTWRQWVYEQSGGTLSTQIGYPFMYNCMTINPYVHTDETLALGDGSSLSSIVTKVSDFDTIENVDVADVSVTRQASDATDLGRLTDIGSNDIDDVNLGIYNANTVTMVDGIYERFWKTTLEKFITTRTLVTQVLLSRNEFVNLDISKYYTLMGQRFILNKIKDFDPMLDEQMVEVELLAVDAFRSSEEVAPPSLLLDQYGEDNRVAYSVRKLRTAYTGNCMRVRNGSSVELDIGFDSSGNLDESALLTHCGSGDGFVTIWYDQSGNGYNMVQATTSRQPLIVSSGSVIKENGKPTLFKDTTSMFMQTSTAINIVNTSNGAFTSLGVLKYSSSYRSCVLGQISNTTTKNIAQFLRNGHTNNINKLRLVVYTNATGTSGSTATQMDTTANTAYIGNQILHGSTSEGDTTKAIAIRYNGGNVKTGTYTLLQNKNSAELFLFDDGRSVPSDFPDTYCQEIICYQANKSDISDIESNINTYFTIYS